MSNLIHFLPLGNAYNVQCLNGSAHVLRTTNFKEVTCPLCLDLSINLSYWSEKRTEYYQRLRVKTEQKIWAGKF